jgi:2-methylcitrate dehydratase PrpD
VGSNHTTLDALGELRKRNSFGAGQVEKIEVQCSQATADHVGWKYQPKSLTAAQLNLPYCAATFLLEGDCSVDQFTGNAFADSRRIALAERVEVIADPAITAKGARYRHMVRVAVHLRGGERLECTKEAPRGSERDFASAAEITRKFEQLARHALPEQRVAELRDAVLGLEKLADAARLAELMRLP